MKRYGLILQKMINIKMKYPTESEEQKALIRWWSIQYPQWELLLFHIPNGGLRNLKTAVRLKSEGVKAGVADLFLAIANKDYHGLFIEMKRQHGNCQTELQKKFQKAVEIQGYEYFLARGWIEARDKILKYLLNK